MLSPERLRGLVTDLENIANALTDGDSCSLTAEECASICCDIAAELRDKANRTHTYTLPEIRNGTGFERGARFLQVSP